MLTDAVAAHNNDVGRDIGFAPNEIHIGTYSRISATILNSRGAKGHQGVKAEQLQYLRLLEERQV